MNPIDSVRQLKYAGHFATALRELDGLRISSEFRVEAQLLRAELLERVGRPGQARVAVESLLKSTDLSLAHQGRCEYVLGKAAAEDGSIEEAITHLQRAISAFERCNYLAGSCAAHIALMLLVSRSGPDAATPFVAQLRRNATKLGDPVTTAALHVFVGEMEVKRGLLNVGYRHANIALGILQSTPNVWLEAAAENIRFAVSIISSNLSEALPFGYRALDLAEQSGGAGIQRACLGNLGNFFLATGDLGRGAEYFERAVAVLPSDGENNNANLDGLARIRLAQDRLADCAVLLDRIDSSIRSESDRSFYAHRYAELTRTQLLAREGKLELALDRAEFVLHLAEKAGDDLLVRDATLLKAELLQRVERVQESLIAASSVIPYLPGGPPDLYAHYERLVTLALARSGDWSGACFHRARAARICESSSTIYELLGPASPGELERMVGPADTSLTNQTRSRSSLAAVFQGVSALLTIGNNLELAARELLALFEQTESVDAARIIRRTSDKVEHLLVRIGDEEPISEQGERHIRIGQYQGSEIELIIWPKNDVESTATINAATLLLAALHEVQRARAEREERVTLWPAEDLPVENGHAVVAGHMRELMGVVQRIARANISVLISGESGTGKEIIARAIHDSSDRARKAFVPVNCAAVPRELMESQLFGHRRGSFTGADRDFAGFIRTAHEGTLFLDEIGELPLDLQPKLLRFLESGEIAPLGTSAPLTVNVRVLAATNKNLEELVRAGRFREDLFYRLNVVPLQIRPLRERREEIPGLVQHFVDRAAREFKKGHLTVAEETMERLLLYRWPGNVRQLQHELQRIVALVEPNSTLLPDMISEEILGALPLLRPIQNPREMAISLNDKLPMAIARIESEMIKLALRDNRGKVDAAAKALGISRKGLYLKRQRLGL